VADHPVRRLHEDPLQRIRGVAERLGREGPPPLELGGEQRELSGIVVDEQDRALTRHASGLRWSGVPPASASPRRARPHEAGPGAPRRVPGATIWMTGGEV